MNNNLSTQEWVRRAYKKLKGNLYFDKTQLPTINDLVTFESESLDKRLSQIADALNKGDTAWDELVSPILNKTDVFVYPKKLYPCKDNQIIFNTDTEPIEMEKPQYFINLPITGHILGTLWVLIFGSKLDNRNETDDPTMYEHSYGNRLRKSLYNKDSKTIVFKPIHPILVIAE